MANSLSAKKRIRQNEKHRMLNRARSNAVKTQIKKFEATVHDSSDFGKVETEMRLAQKKIQQLAAHGVIHKKTASRKIARLARALNTAKAKAS